MINFDAANTYYKSIKGAVAAGNTLRLRVILPRSFGVSYCFLVLHKDNEQNRYISMTWEKTDGIEEHWYTDINLNSPELLFYHFEYETPWGKTVLKRDGKKQTSSVYGKELWQLTVYSPEFTTPERFKGGIIYQIFPDRFCFSGEKKNNIPFDRILRNDYNSLPEWKPDSNGKVLNNDFFCGDFKGITQKLDYIASLGVDCIYLNPISEAHSNHRYDTADYFKPDVLLGTDDDFKELCNNAHKKNIKILIDGVYSHTGADSIYFNKFGRYPNLGAYQSESSPYYKWYTFKSKNKYLSWWGIDVLPEVNENEPSFSELITGKNGVVEHWLKLGADGIRLDVADELPDSFLDKLRIAVKCNSEQNLIVGEVWEDASNKISGGKRRRYFEGKQLDSVMNYPFRTAIIDFLLTSNASRFMDAVFEIVLNYPPQVINECMNILGTHDTERILTALSGNFRADMTREQQSKLYYSDEKINHSKKLLKMAAAILYTLPGIPSIYYGDEAGMLGGKDPFNRCCYPWGREDCSLIDYYKKLGEIRKNSIVLQDGEFIPLSAELGCIAYLRYKQGCPRICTIANKNPVDITYNLNCDMRDMMPVIGGIKTDGAVIVPAETGCILTDL